MTVNVVVVAFVLYFMYETIKKLCIMKYEPVSYFLNCDFEEKFSFFTLYFLS